MPVKNLPDYRGLRLVDDARDVGLLAARGRTVVRSAAPSGLKHDIITSLTPYPCLYNTPALSFLSEAAVERIAKRRKIGWP